MESVDAYVDANDLDCLNARLKMGDHNARIDTYYRAAELGHFGCMKVLDINGVNWAATFCSKGSVCEAAIRGDHLDCLIFTIEKGDCSIFPIYFNVAAKHNALECLDYLLTNKQDKHAADTSIYLNAIQNLETLKIIHKHRVPFDADEYQDDFIKMANEDCLIFAHMNGIIQVPQDICDICMKKTNVAATAYFKAHGYSYAPNEMNEAIEGERFNYLNYLRELWDSDAEVYARSLGKVNVISFMRL